MEIIDVTARFSKDGQVIPLDFVWEGRRFRVESTGRRWEDAQGLHILTMVAGDRVFELIFSAQQKQWFLGRIPPGRAVA